MLTFNDMPETMTAILQRLETLESLLLKLTTPHEIPREIDIPLTISEAAEFLHLSIQTVYQRVSNSTIPYSKAGNRLYFNKKELLEWITAGRKKTIKEIEAENDEYLDTLKAKKKRR